MTATETEYQKLVGRLSEDLDKLKGKIPGLRFPHPMHTAFVRSRRTVPREFILTTAAKVDHDEELRRLNTLDPNLARDAVQYVEAFRPFRDELAALLKAVTYTIEVRQAEAAEGALQTYALAKVLARTPGSNCVNVVSDLKRDLHRAGRRGKKKKGKPEPEAEE